MEMELSGFTPKNKGSPNRGNWQREQVSNYQGDFVHNCGEVLIKGAG